MSEADRAIMPDLCNRDHPFHYTTALNLLTRLGVDIDTIELIAVGEHENYKGEIRSQEPKPGTPLKRDTHIVLGVGTPSAVDHMPYQFFYGLLGRTSRVSDWEQSARLLMAPFDAAVIRHDAASRLESLRFSFGVIDEWQIHRFLQLFDFDAGTFTDSFDEAIVWSAIMPSFHEWAGNPDRVAEILGLLFGYRFRIVENIPSQFDIPEEVRYRLGAKSARLGRESIIGRSFVEYDSTYEVVVSGLTREDAADILPGKPTRKKLDRVLDICMPGHLDYRFRFEISDRKMKLETGEAGSRLGYSTHISREFSERRATTEG